MKLKLNKNIGADDLRQFGLMPGNDGAELRKALSTYAKGRIVDVPAGDFQDYLIKRGLATETDEALSPPPVKGVAKPAAITAPAAENFKDHPHEPAPKKEK